MSVKRFVGCLLTLSLVVGGVSLSGGAEPPEPGDEAVGRTPPRLSFVDGQVSFWRPGADEWAQAQINTPLAPGDQLYTGPAGNVELQIGGRAFVRAWGNTQLGLENQEPDFLQFKVTGGRTAFDLRTLEPGRTVEVNTPNAAFTIEHPGYYRVDVVGERTSFITRRSGRAIATPARGEAFSVAASEEVVLEGVTDPLISSYAAPRLDEWDKWNYARTDALLDAMSARYVSPGTYGVDDLDRYGTWRVVDTYGPIWVPTGMPAGWVPYSAGSWVLDPYYGWTWVDTAPWGWAPYHHGRWVFVNGYWAWAPGPVRVRSVYAPALVAFFGAPGVGVSVGIGGPVVGWVALGWGEPCVPWWGRPGFIHRPWWGGWAGPRVVNNVVINRTTVVNVQQINVYRNTQVRNAVIVVDEHRFGRGHVGSTRVAPAHVQHLQPAHTGPKVAAVSASFVPSVQRGIRPPEEHLKRSVVATRQPHRGALPGHERSAGPTGISEPAPHLVSPPRRGEPGAVASRPPFGQGTVERSAPDRRPVPPRPKPEGGRGGEQSSGAPAAADSPGKGPASVPPTAPHHGDKPRPDARGSEASKPPADRGHAKVSSGRESPGRSGRAPDLPPAARHAKPSPQSNGQMDSVSPGAQQPAAARAGEPPRNVGRPEMPRPSAKSLPGEPASRLAPNRAEAKPSQQHKKTEHQPGPSKDRPRGEPGKQAGERKGS
jgi:hypothetical protein